MGRSWRRLGVGIAVAAAGCGLLGPPATEVRIDPGLEPRLSPAQVAEIVEEQLLAGEQELGRQLAPTRITRIVATPPERVHEIQSTLDLRGSGHEGIVWVVHAEGTFVSLRASRDGEPVFGSSGYYLIADTDGLIFGLGIDPP